ncbi:MAG: hypothetical protein U5L45_05355 [Saprospiraceae bacterium]|nr:hypothetical protein [Saprospiraceae bacterium]
MAGKKNTKETVKTIGDRAKELLQVRNQQKDLKEQEDALVAELRDYVQQTGDKEFGGVLAYERTGIAKFGGLENKALDVAIEQLVNELDPTYVKKVLNVSKMYAALQTDKALYGHLSQKGLTITQGVDIYFKAIK